jgi:outer membrane protein assembly factor BamB
MFETAPIEPQPWYRSMPILLLASLLFPPLGLVLLLANPAVDAQKKIIGSLGIVGLGLTYGVLIFGFPSAFVSSPADAHYDELERQRAAQRASVSEPTSQPAANQPAATATTPGATSAAVAQPAAAEPASAAKPVRNYWTEFRGPGRAGRYDEAEVLTAWPKAGLRELWRQPIGEGYSSFSVAEGHAFTSEKRRHQEATVAYDLGTGRELWTDLTDVEFVEGQGDGPRATPTWDEGRLYALGGTGELRCVDSRNGKLIWSRDTLKENGARNLQWGQAVSPLVVDDKVVVLPGGSPGKSVVAYNKLTGAPAWKSLDDRQAYTSPMLVTLAGKRQILVVSATRVIGLAVENGAVLWDYPWDTQMGINVSQPLMVDEKRFFISAGYGKGCALVEVTANGQSFAARKVWENIRMKTKFNSPVLHDGYVYGLDEGILTCVNVDTGEQKWKDGRFGYGQVLLASGHLIVIS